MIRRSLSAAALVGALVVSPHAVAKPPDLPMNETITVTPPASLYEALPDAVPTPTLYQLRPTARRTLVGSMLLGLNPVLGWLPIEKALDAPHDHPQKVAGDDVFSDLPKEMVLYPGFDGTTVFLEKIDCLKWFVIHSTKRFSMPATEQNEGHVQATDDITCPYLRQQRTNRQACQFTDSQIGRDVLDNLERLKQAGDLIETAQALAAAGCLGEAMECCVLAQELCPGSPSADRAAAVLFGLCFGFDQPEMDVEEAAEEQQPETSADSHSQGESFWGWLAQWVGLPINVYDAEPNRRILELLSQSEDLKQIEAEWQLIEWMDMPSHLTPERVHGGLSPDGAEPGVEEQVRGLMKACRLLMCEGLHEQAAELARQAFALDPERVMADPLLYKMHLLADTPRSHESSEASEPPSCPYCPSIGKPIQGIVPQKKESDPGPTTLLVPPMPPVDYEVVPALDRVLVESAGAEEAREEAEPSSLPALIEEIMDSVGVDANGGLRLSGEWLCGSSVYHLRYNRGCLAIWKTPDAAKVKP
jgi:hypothetical protein